MNIKIIEKDIKATDAILEYIEKKLERVEKYFTMPLDVEVTLKEEGNFKISQFSVKVNKNVFRSIAEHTDLYASFDRNIDILERQISKEKAKMEQAKREVVEFTEDLEESEIENEIIKYQSYEPKPMDPEDAKLILSEHKTNNFLTFVNINTGKVNVIFKLKDKKNFGLVVPE